MNRSSRIRVCLPCFCFCFCLFFALVIASGATPTAVEQLSQFMPGKDGDIGILKTNEGLQLTTQFTGFVKTSGQYKTPLRIDVVAKTNGNNIRLYFGPK